LGWLLRMHVFIVAMQQTSMTFKATGCYVTHLFGAWDDFVLTIWFSIILQSFPKLIMILLHIIKILNLVMDHMIMHDPQVVLFDCWNFYIMVLSSILVYIPTQIPNMLSVSYKWPRMKLKCWIILLSTLTLSLPVQLQVYSKIETNSMMQTFICTNISILFLMENNCILQLILLHFHLISSQYKQILKWLEST